MTAVHADTRSDVRLLSRSVIIGVALLAVAIVLLMVALATSDQPIHAIVWGGLAFTTCAASYLWLIGARYGVGLGLAGWRFGTWTLLWYGITFGIASITFIQPQIGTSSQISLTSVLRALWLVGIAMTVWTLGYLAGPGEPLRRFATRRMQALGRRFTTEVRGIWAPWILYAIGSGARIAFAVTSGRFGYVGDASSAFLTAGSSYGQILSALSLCAPLAVCAAAFQVFRERLPIARITLTLLFLTEFAIGAASGAKQSFIILTLAIIVPYSGARRRLPKAALIVAAAAFMLIIIPFTSAYRGAALEGEAELSTSQAINAAPGILSQTVTPHNIATVLPSSADYLLQRIREIDSPAIILQRTPQQIAFRNPTQLVEAPIVEIVPRALWANKPIMTSGYILNREYYDTASDTYSSSSLTPMGSLYQYGGWLPVIAGMLVLGCGARLLDDIIEIDANPHSVLLLLLLFPNLVKSEQGWVDLVASIPQTIAIWLLACLITFRLQRPV